MLVSGYNFTDRVREVLQAAREEAARLRHLHVGTEHILLGILRRSDSMAARILTSCGIDLATLGASVEALCNPGSTEASRGDLPYTSRGKKVIEEAMKEAQELNHNYVGTEHLLLGLLRESRGIAYQALRAAGLTPAIARTKAFAILGSDPVTQGPRQNSWSSENLVASQATSEARLAVMLSVIAILIAIVALGLSLK